MIHECNNFFKEGHMQERERERVATPSGKPHFIWTNIDKNFKRISTLETEIEYISYLKENCSAFRTMRAPSPVG